MRLLGAELKVGDVIETWWQPGRDTIVALSQYRGPYQENILKGARIATFAIGPGMTIEAEADFTAVARSNLHVL